MKLVYCPADHTVGIKSRWEPDRCETCGGKARVVHIRFPWQYWAGAGIVSAGAIFLLLPQLLGGLPWESVVATLELRLVWLVVFVGFGLAFSNWGIRVMKERALAQGKELASEASR